MALTKPNKSKVSYDLTGKTILIYGTNSTGKTFQATKFPRPVVFAAEYGLDGLNNVDYYRIKTWSDFVKRINEFDRNLDEVKENWDTIVLDELSVLIDLCERYTCDNVGVKEVKDANNGYGAWKEFRGEFKRQFVRLLNLGLTVVVLAHAGEREFVDKQGMKYMKIYPRGDKALCDAVCDAVDIIGYAEINNPDDQGNEVKSSLYLKGSREFHARSRFPAMVPYLKEFTAKNLENAIRDAVKAQEETDGVSAVSYEEQQEDMRVDAGPTYEELFESIKNVAMKMDAKGMFAKYKEVVEKYLGAGRGVQDTTPAQTQVLELILDELKDFAA